MSGRPRESNLGGDIKSKNQMKRWIFWFDLKKKKHFFSKMLSVPSVEPIRISTSILKCIEFLKKKNSGDTIAKIPPGILPLSATCTWKKFYFSRVSTMQIFVFCNKIGPEIPLGYTQYMSCWTHLFSRTTILLNSHKSKVFLRDLTIYVDYILT